MINSQELLRAYVQLIRRASHASIVSLYLPSLPPQRPILIHDGTPPAIPELADEDAAEQFAKRAAVAESCQTTSPTRLESELTEGLLIRVPTIESLLSLAADVQPARERRQRGDSDRKLREIMGSAWLGLRLDGVGAADVEGLTGLLDPSRSLDPGSWALAVGGALAWHDRHVSTLVNDPVSRLPGRTALQEMSQQAMLRACEARDPVGLLLANPDDFAVVNQRYGREAGDDVIREIAGRVVSQLRPDDFICRYGGAIFGVLVSNTGPQEIAAMATRLRPALTEKAYLDGAVRLGFSFGMATYTPAKDEDGESAALTLIRRADSALNAAKLAGGGQIVSWQPGAEFEKIGQHDRLSGIFTANLTKDYRNMLLLWDTVGIVAANPDVDGLVGQVLQKLATIFNPDRLAWFEQGPNEQIRLLQSLARPSGDATSSEWAKETTFELDHMAMLHEARETGLPAQGRDAATVGYAFPLMANDRCLGGLYLEGKEASSSVDASDVVFLKGLSDQIAVALDRARLVEHERLRQDQESQQLRDELQELRQALEQERLVHCSEPMESLFTTLRRVAPTDATVLIHGESGTGKELIARTLHQLSPRRQKPLVVVDCTAIAMSLMESELFGHEKGAYTGAEQRSAGRLAEADGGTVVLDEIGELPLQVQSKLLRFVQEKQYTPVGSSKPLEVDARVIAVTNRDLAAEVAARRFREDLYYRLNVVSLVVPPLRERAADIRLLAQHFLKMFSIRYQKRIHGLTPEAEDALMHHTWPGNVRELQNCMTQAVILCEGDAIGLSEIGLAGADAPRATTADPVPAQASADEAWAALESALAERIRAALANPAARLPLGKWTGEELVVEAFAAADDVCSSAAALLGIPETTFRRRMQKSRTAAEIGLASRPPGWDAARSCIRNVVRSTHGGGQDLLKRARIVVLQEIVRQLPEDAKLGSILMGVTEPTFHRWRAELLVFAA